ncbi:hypothetical protein [Neorhizobium tomejilense]|uniref:hypothetical protein n=1 Tax=Neorhizobium tomejilense TaxID=2093828 RepID=UPI00155E691B|nr:hypothetical protein [Neorhizobium tomejilense]
METKTYIIVFFNPNINIEHLNRWIVYSPYVLSYWNYLPLTYFIKSTANVNELRIHFEPVLGLNNFLIAEVNTHNISGRLPPEAWPWFTQTVFPPKPPPPNTQVTPSSGGFFNRLLDVPFDRKP